MDPLYVKIKIEILPIELFIFFSHALLIWGPYEFYFICRYLFLNDCCLYCLTLHSYPLPMGIFQNIKFKMTIFELRFMMLDFAMKIEIHTYI